MENDTTSLRKVQCFNGIFTKEHLVASYKFGGDFDVIYQDVTMKLFVQILEDDVRRWDKSLCQREIATSHAFIVELF